MGWRAVTQKKRRDHPDSGFLCPDLFYGCFSDSGGTAAFGFYQQYGAGDHGDRVRLRNAGLQPAIGDSRNQKKVM